MMGLGGVRPTTIRSGQIIELFDDAGYRRRRRHQLRADLSPLPAAGRGGQRRRRADRRRRAQAAPRWARATSSASGSPGRSATRMSPRWTWRILKFRPADAGQAEAATVPEDLDADAMMRPASSRDTKFFWDGVNAHELRIQKRGDGSLQHPPVPALWQDKEHADRLRRRQSARARCSASSCTTRRRCPAARLPFVIALVELEEGVRMLGELRNVDPASCGDRNAGPRNVYRLPRGDDVGPAWTLYAWEPDA